MKVTEILLVISWVETAEKWSCNPGIEGWIRMNVKNEGAVEESQAMGSVFFKTVSVLHKTQ